MGKWRAHNNTRVGPVFLNWQQHWKFSFRDATVMRDSEMIEAGVSDVNPTMGIVV